MRIKIIKKNRCHQNKKTPDTIQKCSVLHPTPLSALHSAFCALLKHWLLLTIPSLTFSLSSETRPPQSSRSHGFSYPGLLRWSPNVYLQHTPQRASLHCSVAVPRTAIRPLPVSLPQERSLQYAPSLLSLSDTVSYFYVLNMELWSRHCYTYKPFRAGRF